MNQFKFRKKIYLPTLTVGLCLGLSAFAQEQKSQLREGTQSLEGMLEEIIVTAEKRAQDLQEVPVAISAFTSEGLEMRGISNPQDLQQSVPGLSIGEQTNLGGGAKVTLRGVGSENFGPGGDPGVPVHINGHYTQATAYIFRDMIDIERVEVQRGPQGTLYGRNAVGGNINLITKRPSEEFEGSVGFELGNYNRRAANAVISGPLSDYARGRLVAAGAVRDGFVEELGAGDDRDSVDYSSVRGALEIDLTDKLQVYINGYYFDDTGNTYTRRIDRDPNNAANSDPFKVSSNTPDEAEDNSKGVSIDFSLGLESMEFRSLSAYDKTSTTERHEVDGNAIRLAEYGVDIDIEVMTQEFQLISTHDAPLQWVTGIFYYKEDSSEIRNNFIDRFDTDGDGLTGLDYDVDQPLIHQLGKTDNSAESWAVYGQLDYDLTDNLELVAGLRYTRDEKKYWSGADTVMTDGSTVSIPVGGGRFYNVPVYGQVFFDNSEGTDWSEFTWKLGFNYHLSDDAMLYASYTRGYKAGGFSAKQDAFYDPEFVDALEGGLKGRWLENRVQTNLALFYYDYQDKQELQFFPPNPQFPNGGVQLINAASATSYGAELEVQAYVTEAIYVDASISYLSAEYDEFNTIDALFPALGFQSLSGNSLPLSPKTKYNLGAQYDWDLEDGLGSLSIRADYSWTDDQWGNALNRDNENLLASGDRIPSYYIVNGRVQWKSSDNSLDVSFYARNLTDEPAISNAFVGSTQEVNQSNIDPRTYGIKVNYTF